MNSNITVSVSNEIRERLKEIENKSALINDLLAQHFELLTPVKVDEKAIVERTKAKMEAEKKAEIEHEEYKLKNEKLKAKWAEMKKNPKIVKEYEKGYKEGKWANNWEFMENFNDKL